MTFTEIFEHIYQSSDGTADRANALGPLDRAAWRMYRLLDGRKGFDWWWHDIEPEVKDEIFEGIKQILYDHHHGDTP